MRKNILFITSCLLAATTFAEDINTLPKDTTKVIDIEEVVVIASPKETGKLRELPTAVSLLSQKDMQANQITTLKNVSSLVPNFFMPDYGSRLTSAIYIIKIEIKCRFVNVRDIVHIQTYRRSIDTRSDSPDVNG